MNSDSNALQRQTDEYDFTRRDVMVPMRDGVKLHTVILVPKGARRAPILLTRTPYDATGHRETPQTQALGEGRLTGPLAALAPRRSAQ